MFENYPLLEKDRKLMQKTKIPVVTVAATYRDELARFHGEKEYYGKKLDEVLFSRAHYSMALAALVGAWKGNVPVPSRAWGIDPTNYVTGRDWLKVEFTEEVGKAMARFPLLKWLKDKVDSRARNKLPITDAITVPLLHVFEHVHRPILSFHYESGNILAAAGKQVVQVVTDPHVREQYLDYAQLPSMRFCVFDERTKTEFLEKADIMGKVVDPRRVIVTGPPVDPRIVAAAKKKDTNNLTKRPLRLCITTGGLGNNKDEIVACVRSLAPLLRRCCIGDELSVQLIVYAGVHQDIREEIHEVAHQEGITTSDRTHIDAPLRILHSPHIVEANELLIKYAFPWADGFITKPSGDMAYDAAAAGCFILTLEPWGEWEHNIRDVFEQRQISMRAETTSLDKQIESLFEQKQGKRWIEEAMKRAHHLPPLFTEGIEQILKQMPK